MQASCDAVFAFVMQEEGSTLSLDRSDGGCWSGGSPGIGLLYGSKWGVTAQDLIKYMHPTVAYPVDMANLSRDTAECIFHIGYYQAMRGDDLPAGVDLSVIDNGYNAGAPTSARLLQTTVGAGVDGWIGANTMAAVVKYTADTTRTPSADATRALQKVLGVAVDGDCGPATRAALANHPARNLLGLIAVLSDGQAAHYRALHQFPLYGNGWLARTWRRCAAAMALAVAPGASAGVVVAAPAAPIKAVPPAAVAHVVRGPDVTVPKPEYTSDELDTIFNPGIVFTDAKP